MSDRENEKSMNCHEMLSNQFALIVRAVKFVSISFKNRENDAQAKEFLWPLGIDSLYGKTIEIDSF